MTSPELPYPQIDGTLMERMGMVITHVEPGCVKASMPVMGNLQPYGLLHGGANAALAETVGSIAGGMHAGSDGVSLGLELNCTHHKAVRSGFVHAVATPIYEGNSAATYAITITDDEGNLTCTARLTCVIRKRGRN
jgi:uncharacterized protein (TIGR00369 family)